jgi:hypothetical protein
MKRAIKKIIKDNLIAPRTLDQRDLNSLEKIERITLFFIIMLIYKKAAFNSVDGTNYFFVETVKFINKISVINNLIPSKKFSFVSVKKLRKIYKTGVNIILN